MSDPHHPVDPNQNIGRFPVISKLGRGSFGSVYLAFDPNMGDAATARVAIKVLHENRLSYRDGFLREAQLMRQLNCPGVVTVFEYDEYQDTRTGLTLPFFVMEYCERGTVAMRLANLGRALTLDEGMGLVEAIASSARTLALPRPGHPHGVVHRDLKPTNLLLQRVEDRHRRPVGDLFRADEQLILADFSIAKSVDPDATNLTLSGGTPGWGAPEQFFRTGPDEANINPRADVDVSVDVYAASATVVAAMSNRSHDASTPFTDADFAATGPLEAELRTAMSTDPSRRHADFDQWRDALVAARDRPATVIVDPPGETRPASGFLGTMETVRSQRQEGFIERRDSTPDEPNRPRYALLGSVAAGLLVMAAAAAFVLTRGGPDESAVAGSGSSDGSAIIESVAAPDSIDRTTTGPTAEPSTTTSTTASTTVPPTTLPTTDTSTETSPAASGGAEGAEIIGIGDLCLDVPQQNFRDGQNLWMWECNGTEAQQWTVEGDRLIVAGRCLDIEGPSLDAGTAVQIWECQDLPQHRWRIVDDTIVSELSELCLEVAFGEQLPGASVWMAECNGSAEQRWTIPTS